MQVGGGTRDATRERIKPETTHRKLRDRLLKMRAGLDWEKAGDSSLIITVESFWITAATG